MRPEIQQQKLLFFWAKEMAVAYPELNNMFAIPNGAYYGPNRLQAIKQANSLRAQGLRNGVPDIFLAVAVPTTGIETDEDLINGTPNEKRLIDANKEREYSEIESWYHGLFIEMKSGNNKLSETQKEWHNKLKYRSYKVVVCYSAAEAKTEILKYLSKI